MASKKDTAPRRPLQPLRVVSPVHKALRQISEHLVQRMREIDAPGMDAHLLSYVGAYGPSTVGELRRVFGYQPSTLTSVLDRLEGRSLIERRSDPDDRRTFQVEITAEGRQVGQRARQAVETFEEEILNRLDPRDLEGFAAVMAAIDRVTRVRLRGEDD